MMKHVGKFETCEYCLRYIKSGESYGHADDYAATTRKLHGQAMARRNRVSRDDMMKECGLIKVRGALGGIYYE